MNAIWFTDKPMATPYSSGLYSKDFTLAEMRKMSAEITDEERLDPFFKYYSEELAPLQPEHIETIKAGASPSSCGFMPSETGHVILDNAAGHPENCFCVLDNGVGFASMLIKFEDCTDEMFAKYRDEFCHTKNRRLQYKIWYPHMHMIHFEDAIIENWGWGFCLQEMRPELYSFETLGVDPALIPEKITGCIGFLATGGNCIELDDPSETKWPMTMIQITRETPAGRELRVLYWNGCGCDDNGNPIVKAKPDRAQTEEHMKMMYHHCVQEYMNQIRLMKQFRDNGYR
jgi:hypothetical protein